MVALDRDDLIGGLRDVVARLRERGESAGIHIVGGAALALRYFERDTTNDIAQLLAICEIGSVDDAEELYEEFFPGELPKDSTYRILDTVFRVGLPSRPDSPATFEL